MAVPDGADTDPDYSMDGVAPATLGIGHPCILAVQSGEG